METAGLQNFFGDLDKCKLRMFLVCVELGEYLPLCKLKQKKLS